MRQIEYIPVTIPSMFYKEYNVTYHDNTAKGVVVGYIDNTITLGQCIKDWERLAEWEKKHLLEMSSEVNKNK